MTNNKSQLTDIELIRAYDIELGAAYEDAKNSYREAPIQSLVILRELTETVCKTLAEEFRVGMSEVKDFNDLIMALGKIQELRPSIRLMNAIRHAGNDAAHPPVNGWFDNASFRDRAYKTLLHFCDLIEALSTSLGKGLCTYHFEESLSSNLQEISYQAAYLNDHHAKYKLGMALISEGQDRLFIQKESNDNGCIHRGLEWLKQAGDAGETDALYNLGLVSLSQIAGLPSPKQAISYLHKAANSGHADALAMFGSVVFEYNEQDHYIEALECLEESAKQAAHPLALTTLAELYWEGEYTHQDKKLATLYLERAKADGFAPAMWLKAKWCCQDGQYKTAVALLHQCIELGYRQAALQLANLCGVYDLAEPKEILSYFDQYFKSSGENGPEYVTARLRAEKLRFSSGSKGLESHFILVQWLTTLYRHPDCSDETGNEIKRISPAIMAKYTKLYQREKPDDDKYLVAFFDYTYAGVPREQQAQTFELISKIGQSPESLSFYADEFYSKGMTLLPNGDDSDINAIKASETKAALQKQKLKNRRKRKLAKRQRKK